MLATKGNVRNVSRLDGGRGNWDDGGRDGFRIVSLDEIMGGLKFFLFLLFLGGGRTRFLFFFFARFLIRVCGEMGMGRGRRGGGLEIDSFCDDSVRIGSDLERNNFGIIWCVINFSYRIISLL